MRKSHVFLINLNPDSFFIDKLAHQVIVNYSNPEYSNVTDDFIWLSLKYFLLIQLQDPKKQRV